MGGLFSSFLKSSLPDVMFDLENAKPNDDQERSVSDEFRSTVIEPSTSIFSRFSNYQDGQMLAAAAISNPTQAAKDAAWDSIYPNVLLQMEVFTFAKTVSEKFVSLIRIVMEMNTGNPTDVFSKKPIITKCFADCFDIILRLDEIKLGIPKLLNDLAFFRRNAPLRNEDNSLDEILERSNMSTVFWASPTPMLNDAITALQNAYPQGSDSFQKLLVLLGGVSDVCTSLVIKGDNSDEKAVLLCLRCITGSILMYDHLNPAGAYTTKVGFHVREALDFLVNYTPKQNGLINAIKYSSKHLAEPTTDTKIRTLFQ